MPSTPLDCSWVPGLHSRQDFFHFLQRPILKRTSLLKLLPWKMAPSTWSRSSSQPGQERNPLFPAQHIKHRIGSQPCWPCCCRKAKEKKNRLHADIDLKGAAYSGKRTSRAAAFDDASSSGESAADRYTSMHAALRAAVLHGRDPRHPWLVIDHKFVIDHKCNYDVAIMTNSCNKFVVVCPST